MNILNAIVLGIVQGLTEFLPVSSSGHLVIAQSLFGGFYQPGVLFDVILHLGTALSTLVFFRSRIFSIKSNFLGLIVIGSIPAGIVGFIFSDFIESIFSSTTVVGIALLLTGIMNWQTDKSWGRRKFLGKIDAFFVGIAQAFAIIPGISRSGSTIFAATSLGVDRAEAAEFSFLLSVPAIAGASLYQLAKYAGEGGASFGVYLFGFLAAFVSGLIAISLAIRFLTEKRFKIFAFYCFFVGLLAVLVF